MELSLFLSTTAAKLIVVVIQLVRVVIQVSLSPLTGVLRCGSLVVAPFGIELVGTVVPGRFFSRSSGLSLVRHYYLQPESFAVSVAEVQYTVRLSGKYATICAELFLYSYASIIEYPRLYQEYYIISATSMIYSNDQ